ncbi:DUF4199 domain-containing protein [Flavobacterium tiangeerense]|uniref:DUF4199 domain-containing protein n=1 Tax=Flavobacterium tiangeerense TaxID=459471 RepID=UPI0011A7F499|nr:DUF4199 domain-containing protein [Flavobacterium tiangeerense]
MKKLKIEIKWAILFSIMTLLWMVLEKLSGLHSNYIDYHLYLTNLFAIPAIWFMVMALQEKKKVYYGGQMSYKQGLISGLILSVIIAMLSPLTQWIISYVISPEYFPNVIKRSVEIGYFKSTAEAEANFNYSNYAKQGAIGALIMGIVTTAVAMIFIRSKKLE